MFSIEDGKKKQCLGMNVSLRHRASFVGSSLFRMGGLRSSVNHVLSLICTVMSRNPRETVFPNDSCLL